MNVLISGIYRTETALEPTYIGSVNGRRFYEHPLYGDETTMIEKVAYGRYVSTEFWELEDAYQGIHPLAG